MRAAVRNEVTAIREAHHSLPIPQKLLHYCKKLFTGQVIDIAATRREIGAKTATLSLTEAAENLAKEQFLTTAQYEKLGTELSDALYKDIPAMKERNAQVVLLGSAVNGGAYLREVFGTPLEKTDPTSTEDITQGSDIDWALIFDSISPESDQQFLQKVTVRGESHIMTLARDLGIGELRSCYLFNPRELHSEHLRSVEEAITKLNTYYHNEFETPRYHPERKKFGELQTELLQITLYFGLKFPQSFEDTNKQFCLAALQHFKVHEHHKWVSIMSKLLEHTIEIKKIKARYLGLKYSGRENRDGSYRNDTLNLNLGERTGILRLQPFMEQFGLNQDELNLLLATVNSEQEN